MVGALTLENQIVVQKWFSSRLGNLYNGLTAKGSHIAGGKLQKPGVYLRS